MTPQLRKRMVRTALLLAFAVIPCAAKAQNETPPVASATRLSDVTVTEQQNATVVHIKTSGAATYRAELIESPHRLVVDLEDTVYDWRRKPLVVGTESVKQVRGSQYRKATARVVVEFTHKVGYAIREDADGLAIIVPTVPPSARRESAGPGPVATEPQPPTVAPKAMAAVVPTPAFESALAPAGAVTAPGGTPAPPPTAMPARPAAPARATREERAPVRIAQAPTQPAPPAARAGGQRLISLEFKDADVVNLLRILAAEAGRNLVIGDDVKGKMSISLRNVPWDLALEIILDARALEKVEKDGVMRIVTREQLTKDRESKARVEEARIKGEAEARTKLAEAQVKEAEAIQKKLAAEAARMEQEARGPLREETIRLSYADPEEVAKTLQGILGISAEGQKVEGLGIYGGPPIAEPPFSQLFGPPGGPPPPPRAPVSISQEVLAKGLTIRAHKPTNTLFLRLYAADLERVKRLIRESLDIPLPQVKIEARMEILDRSALEEIGVQWGGATAQPAGSQTIVGRGFADAALAGIPVVGLGVPPNPNLTLSGALPVSSVTGLPLGGNLVNLPIGSLPNTTGAPTAGLAFGIVGTRYNINLALQALSEQRKTRTLARPEVVTVENSKATMSLGEEIPYATVSSAGTQIQFKEALLKLEVTPTVIREGDVTKIKIIVIVENNSRGATVNLGSSGTPPAINRRKAETQVILREGERLIIGGVTNATNDTTIRKVPLFGDIPLLGWLFKQREIFESGRELVVFLTPTVLRTIDRTAAAAPAPPAPAPK
jgi:type IV pilus assembly protein PilQ